MHCVLPRRPSAPQPLRPSARRPGDTFGDLPPRNLLPSLPSYLHDDAFLALFGMDKAAFKGLAAWKRKPLKVKHGLF